MEIRRYGVHVVIFLCICTVTVPECRLPSEPAPVGDTRARLQRPEVAVSDGGSTARTPAPLGRLPVLLPCLSLGSRKPPACVSDT